MVRRTRKATWLVGAAALVAVVFAPSAMATSVVDASKSATGHWTRSFEWTIDKSVTPASHSMQAGQSGTSTYTIALTKSAGTDSAWVDGSVCVTNVGADVTENLTITDRVQVNTGSGFPPGQFIATAAVDTSGNPVLDSGESHCYAYSIPLTPVAGAIGYRNNAAVRVTNDPRCSDGDPTTAPGCNPGDPFGPNVVADFNLPASPTLINNAVNVDDTNPAGDAGPFTSSTSYSYDRTFTCDGDQGTHVNTATIVETGQSDNATVTVTCTPPPPPGGEGCTPGYWKNHPESYGGTGVTSTSTLASVGFNVAATLTFQTALSTGGGGIRALLRHASAAYLNAASPNVDYSLTTAQVVAMTNAAIASGSYEATKNIFEGHNEDGAPGFCD
jgi:hypothetical protein